MNLLVAGEGHYAFRHALLGEAVYDDLLPGERVRLHAAYAAALRDGTVRGTAAELARHARLALDLDTALHASIQAGREAGAVGGPDEAAQHYQQALELLADPRRRRDVDLDVARLAVDTADALVASGHPDRAAAVLAEQLGAAAGRRPGHVAGADPGRAGERPHRHRDRRGPRRAVGPRAGAGARGRARPLGAGGG